MVTPIRLDELGEEGKKLFTMARALRRALGYSAIGTAAGFVISPDVREFVTIGALGSISTVWLRFFNHTHLHRGHILSEALANTGGTPAGPPRRGADPNQVPRGVITVSNHASTVDDPGIIAVCQPYAAVWKPKRMRYVLCADGACFRKQTMLQRALGVLAEAGRALPITRGGGMDQPSMRKLPALLDRGEWVHMFPSGKTNPDPSTLAPFKRGVGSTVLDCVRPPTIIPFYHHGVQSVMPPPSDPDVMYVAPSTGNHIHILFGEPISVDDLMPKKPRRLLSAEERDAVSEAIANRMHAAVDALRKEMLASLEAERAA